MTEETDAGEAFCRYIVMIDFVYNMLYIYMMYVCIWIESYCLCL